MIEMTASAGARPNSSESAQALAETLNCTRPESALTIGAGPRDRAALETLVDTVTACAGRLDVLVNNASSFYPALLASVTERQWQDLINKQPQGTAVPVSGGAAAAQSRQRRHRQNRRRASAVTARGSTGLRRHSDAPEGNLILLPCRYYPSSAINGLGL